jgi:hypothetical protein
MSYRIAQQQLPSTWGNSCIRIGSELAKPPGPTSTSQSHTIRCDGHACITSNLITARASSLVLYVRVIHDTAKHVSFADSLFSSNLSRGR